MSEWKEYKLGDCIEAIIDNRGKSAPTNEIGGFPLMEINCIGGYYPNYSAIRKYVDENTYKNWFRSGHPVSGDILIPTVGTIGIISMMDNTKACIAQNLIALRIKKDISNVFIYYYLKNPRIKKELLNLDIGGVQPSIKVPHLLNLSISLPPREVQTKIASVLSSLDDKIDLLNRENATLEAMAETLFRQWFIEDAKEDWEEKPLSSIATFLNGLACQKYPPKNEIEKLPVLKIRELTNGIGADSDWATTDVGEEYIVQSGDVIFAWSASLMVKIWDGEDCILNQHLFKVTSTTYPKWFYYLWCKHHLNEFIAIAQSHATTMGHIKRNDLDTAMVLVPSPDELKILSETMEPIFSKLKNNNYQLVSLRTQRDILLPKLMSNEIEL